MRINPLPDDERSRLRALDTIPPEQLKHTEFANRLVKLAVRHFDVRDSFIGVIDWDKEHFLACAGSELEPLPREDTLCAYTITQDETIVIEHVQDDPRFKDNETIEEFGIHWYASAPITIKGQNVGTFCIIDDKQREFSDADREDLQWFADETAEMLRLHSTHDDTLLEHIRVNIRDRFGI